MLKFSRLHLSAALGMCVVLSGCGSSSSGPPVAYVRLTGNWQITSQISSVYQSPLITSFGGSLQSKEGVVTGVLQPTGLKVIGGGTTGPYSCVDFGQALQVTGTIDASSNLKLTFPIAGGTGSVTAILGPDLQTEAVGSYQIVGGTCATSAAPMTIAQIAAATGTYIGVFNGDRPNTAITVTAVLTQALLPDGNGQFPLTGTVTAAGFCPGSLTLTNYSALGQFIVMSSHPSNSPNFSGRIAPDASSLTSASFSTASPCDDGQYVGSLTRQ